MSYTVRTKRLSPDTYEFTTLDASGRVVSTLQMSRTRAITLGLIG